MSAIDDIIQKGWTNAEFGLSIATRARFTELGNQLIDLAMQDPKIHAALTFTLLDRDDTRGSQANLFTVSPAMHSADQKLWLHAGYQTRSHVEAAVPEGERPQVLVNFLDAVDELLIAIERGFHKALREIGAEDVFNVVYHPDPMQRVIHIRVVRYIGARKHDAPNEPVTGHSDMSLCTLHLYETHGNWFQAVPYPQELITNSESPQKDQKIKVMRSNLKLIEAIEDQPIFFLGAGWKQLGVSDLPACYHAGVRPAKDSEFISPFAEQVAGNDVDRVSLVVFAQPNIQYAKENNFPYASVMQSRPDTAVEL